ncbi:MAG TPA: DUF192 domain-containing protein [Vicinamibacterales bacterium]|jgi:hypothetical protein|nr:DUF192 domain-containing protein [Vicinamibacterales bacterium]
MMRTTLVNARTGGVIASAVEVADTRARRRRGLLGRDRLDPCAALVLTPCFVIHTLSMRFAIDVLFLDRADMVVRVVTTLEPGRIALARRAHSVVEFAAGALASRDVAVGDRLYFEPGFAADGGVIQMPLSSTVGV